MFLRCLNNVTYTYVFICVLVIYDIFTGIFIHYAVYSLISVLGGKVFQFHLIIISYLLLRGLAKGRRGCPS